MSRTAKELGSAIFNLLSRGKRSVDDFGVLKFEDLSITSVTPAIPECANARLSCEQNQNGTLSVSLTLDEKVANWPGSTSAVDITAADHAASVFLYGAVFVRTEWIGVVPVAKFAAPRVGVRQGIALKDDDDVTIRFYLTDLFTDKYPLKAVCNFRVGGVTVALAPITVSGIIRAALVAQSKFGQFAQLQEIAARICWLLAFANGVSLNLPIFPRILISKDTNTHTELLDVPANASAQKGLINPLELRIPKEIEDYLQWSHDRFALHEKNYSLRRVVHWLSLAMSSPILHLRALIALEVLEVLRFSFASSILVPTGRAKQKGFNFFPPGGGKRIEFEEILRELAADLGLHSWTPMFVKFRNKMVHEGEIFGGSFHEQAQNTRDVLHFCHSVVLALLEWDQNNGYYWPITEIPATLKRFSR
jgi:hypothetical protein